MKRFSRDFPCMICGGFDRAPRGQGVRCYGFLSSDGKYAHCTRPEKGGRLSMSAASTYPHKLEGDCYCGMPHDGSMGIVTTYLDDAHNKHHRRKSKPEERGELVQKYVYFDAYGKPAHRTLRYANPKSFSQQRYQNGEWKWGLGDSTTYLYNLPGILNSPQQQTIFLVEGEKDADSLSKFGLIGTTMPMGAKHWKNHYSAWLRMRRVVILEDNDEEGYLRTALLAKKLSGVVASLLAIQFPDLEISGDISDWIEKGGDPRNMLREGWNMYWVPPLRILIYDPIQAPWVGAVTLAGRK